MHRWRQEGHAQSDRAAPSPLYTGANSLTGRAEGPSAVFSTSLAAAFQYPKMSQERFLGGVLSCLGASTIASFSAAGACAFSVRLTSDAVVDGAREFATEVNAERRFHTSLMSFSCFCGTTSASVSRSDYQTDITSVKKTKLENPLRQPTFVEARRL